MAAVYSRPWMSVLPLTTANTVYNLWDLIQATTNKLVNHGNSPLCRQLAIQYPYSVGGTAMTGYVFIGSSDLSASQFGSQIVPSQTWPCPYTEEYDGIDLSKVYVMSDTNTQYISVQVLQS